MLLPQHTLAESENGFPVNRADFRNRFEAEQRGKHSVFVYGIYGPASNLPPLEEEHYDRLTDFISRIDKIGIYDQELLDTIQEPCEAYFAGDKTLDETVDLIQRRVALYVNEKI